MSFEDAAYLKILYVQTILLCVCVCVCVGSVKVIEANLKHLVDYKKKKKEKWRDFLKEIFTR